MDQSGPPCLSDYGTTGALLESGSKRLAADRSPSVSVITVVRNGAATIDRTIDSVQRQSLEPVEHVVVDGGSTDGTRERVAARLRPQDFWISEPDRGISDAFNKGVALSTGRYLLFLNADDWAAPRQLKIAVACIERTGADFVYGDLVFHEDSGARFLYRGEAEYGRAMKRRMPALNHPTALIRRDAFERIGLFDLRYRCAMDYDWFYRLHRAGGQGTYCPEIVAHMTLEGVSNRRFRRTALEVRDIAVANGRMRLLAEAEALLRIAKTTAAQPIRRNARPLYALVRRRLNRSFQPLARASSTHET